MNSFTISRIHTSNDIFRLAGHYSPHIDISVNRRSDAPLIVYEKVEFMGSDGWCEMDPNNPHAQSVFANIEEEIRAHLDKCRLSK